MTFSVSRRTLTFGITLALGAIAVTGCSAHAPGDIGRLQQILETCPDGQQINSYNAVDVSGTSDDPLIMREHLAYIETKIERVAVCGGGHVTVVAFGPNSVTAPIYETDIAVPGSTDLAKLRRVPGIVNDAMTEVEKNYTPAIALLPEGGTDVIGLFRLFDESKTLRADMVLEAAALTDGLNNQGVVLDHPLSADEATALADQVVVPNLAGASVAVVGIGRVVGDALPSDFIEGMKFFYTRLCQNTQAAQCLVVTDGR
ncbi:hypothetical protein [uncultured Microbacterium sp.]|uniref:hypothetical protein n=1 Tax=uncultured Microbacterium sp. TaxID=191216 RepID=UPI0035CBEFA0